jgi:transcriptional regulator with XRE-family HTH domain
MVNEERTTMARSSKTFGAVISTLRKEKGFGLRELARKMGISPTYLSKIENDRMGAPATDKIKALARLLGVSTDELFAAAKRVPSDVTDMIEQEPEKVTLLLRKAKTLSVEEIKDRLEEDTRQGSPRKR